MLPYFDFDDDDDGPPHEDYEPPPPSPQHHNNLPHVAEQADANDHASTPFQTVTRWNAERLDDRLLDDDMGKHQDAQEEQQQQVDLASGHLQDNNNNNNGEQQNENYSMHDDVYARQMDELSLELRRNNGEQDGNHSVQDDSYARQMDELSLELRRKARPIDSHDDDMVGGDDKIDATAIGDLPAASQLAMKLERTRYEEYGFLERPDSNKAPDAT